MAAPLKNVIVVGGSYVGRVSVASVNSRVQGES
jgi:hypothetical protein